MRNPVAISVRQQGTTLVELLIAATVTGFLAASLLVSLVAVQRNFSACEHHAGRQIEQLRVLDYIGLDLRRALTVDVDNGVIDITIPDYYNSSGVPRQPVISQGQIEYGNPDSPKRVSYYKSGDTIVRDVGGAVTVLANEVEDMNVEFQDLGKVIEVAVRFQPKFSLSQTGDAIRDGTKAYTRILLRNKRRN